MQITLFDLPQPKIAINDKGIKGELGKAPLVISYGGGVDSTAMLIGLYHHGIKPDAILFSDPGNEKPETYAYIENTMQPWLESIGFPAITIIRYQPKRFKWHHYETLAGNCLANRTLPSLAFGYKSCSLKWKGAVLDKKTRELFGDKACYRAIGYDCSPKDNKRFSHAQGKENKSNDEFIYPLQVWGWDRRKCKQVILAAGLPLPVKSSCVFCPSMKADEVDDLEPQYLCYIVIIEANATPNLKTVKGLWRNKRMTDYIREQGLLPVDVIDYLWERWSAPERRINDKTIRAEDVLKQEAKLALERM